MNPIIHRAKRFVVTLRVSILSIFISLFVLIMLTLFFIYHDNVAKIVLRGALLLMDKTSYTILYQLDLRLRPAEAASLLSANHIRENVVNVNDENEMQHYMIQLLSRLPLGDGVFWGDTNGSLVYVHKLNDHFVMEIFNHTAKPPSHTMVYFDKNNKETKRVSNPILIDPRDRPWYQLAVARKTTVWTDVYQFQPLSILGFSVASPAIKDDGTLLGVFGVDIRLDSLNEFIGKQKIGNFGQIFLLDPLGNIISSSQHQFSNLNVYKLLNVNTVSTNWLEKAFKMYESGRQSTFKFDSDDETYLATFIKIPLLEENGWVIAVIDVASDFTHQIHRVQIVYVIIFFTIFFVCLALMSHLVTRIVRPIKKLVKETERIKNFDLSISERIDSRIKEVIELSEAIYAMKNGLRSFQKYVPAGLVRQLIRTGEDAHIGGTKRELVIFFSDIQDFTAVTEKADSDRLVKQVCDYFETLSHVITQHKGTIDKYIGDSIMAFWGAPLSVINPCQNAARAALRCIAFSQVLNTDWVSKRRAILITNIGIHYGEAIVGSLGSSERLNYTVLGDSVNITSRLVNANKMYGTSILVTESFYEQIKDEFVLRLVDKVILKGKEESTAIYELLAESSSRLSFDIDAYRNAFILAFDAYQQQKWDEAIAHFNKCLTIYPQDSLAIIFIERCQQFKKNPPAEWVGVWHISEK